LCAWFPRYTLLLSPSSTLTDFSKPKPVPQSTASPSVSTPSKVPTTPAPSVAETPAIPAAPQQSSSTTTSNVPSTPSPAGVAQSAGNTGGSSAPGGLAMGAERAAQIAEMEAMGFERSQIDLAMRAAFFNGERAIEYLLTVNIKRNAHT